MSEIAANLRAVQERIAQAAARAGRTPGSIRLVAVSKTVSVARIQEAIAAGVRDLGENRVQEAREKVEILGRPVRWHLIGHLQRNKVRYIFQLFDLIHSVDSIELAQEISREAEKRGHPEIDLLLQVHLSEEETKSGFEPEALLRAIEEIARLPHLRVQGLMTIPPYLPEPEEVRLCFRRLKQLAEEIRQRGIPGVSMDELSMGMSHDFEVAIEEGATLVRVGTAIFGARA
ncbi:MAG: YggS family pyridoxal phosphate-dependent enzyme [Candidatus Tectomicrobia bacterium]|uniref:Pyridoxal phosphate homeostasis protein n=1 Tax=Tectimicrobiota bacterium TaxID=2528274 RepID=A0A932CR11_UNCTE|nr:YggS family pyridoxal phosphate-dependent enzyme [Candidatus Tectomicrobia bacterium]